jgi:hypothetical protein
MLTHAVLVFQHKGDGVGNNLAPAKDELRCELASNPRSCSAMRKQASYEPMEDTLRVRLLRE